jgi:hypothetical protein
MVIVTNENSINFRKEHGVGKNQVGPTIPYGPALLLRLDPEGSLYLEVLLQGQGFNKETCMPNPGGFEPSQYTGPKIWFADLHQLITSAWDWNEVPRGRKSCLQYGRQAVRVIERRPRVLECVGGLSTDRRVR